MILANINKGFIVNTKRLFPAYKRKTLIINNIIKEIKLISIIINPIFI